MLNAAASKTQSVISLAWKSTSPTIANMHSFAVNKSLVNENETTSSKPVIESGVMFAISKLLSGSFGTQIRFSHTDVQVPDNSFYRRKSVQSPTAKSRESASGRKMFQYALAAGGGVACTYVAKTIVTDMVKYMAAPASVMAMAKVEINLTEIPEGKSVIVQWRGKPLFIRHRSDAEINSERAVEMSILRDPQPDSARAIEPKWLVVIGICTHLGCIPIANAGDYNGYFCPCHGSHYDAAGRIRKGPAPTNLEIPKYKFIDSSTIVVG